MTLRELSRELVDLFFPKGCLGCGNRIPPEDPLDLVCASCRVRLRPPAPPWCGRCHFPLGTAHPAGEACLECAGWPAILTSARTASVLGDVSGAMVHALKYGGWRNLADLMAQRMLPWVPAGVHDPVLVPVPTTPWRRRNRGYDQASILAGVVASRRDLPLIHGLLRDSGRTQVRLGPRERWANVQSAFRVDEAARSLIRGREVIVIDDVLTTGATAISVASALEEAGVSSVHLLTFARALPFTEARIPSLPPGNRRQNRNPRS